MAITSNCAEIIITNPQGSVSFNKLITTTELSPAKTNYSEDRVYLIQNSENVPQTFWWNLEKAIADGYADLEELYDYFVAEIANQCGGGGGGTQTLAISGNDLSISGGNTVVLPSAGGGTIDYQLTEQLIPFEKYKGQDMYAILLPVSDENGNPYTYVNQADILFISVGKVISEWLVANPSNKIVYINPITPDFTLAQPYDYKWNFPEVLVKYIKEGENFLLQENGDNILQENGDNILI